MTVEHAVVMGGSIAGLLAAAALSPHAEAITILEKDDLPETAEPRRGVPQGRQVHALLAAGQDAMADLLPGIVDDFVAAGARLVDSPSELAVFGSQGWAGRVKSDARTVMMRRPQLEHVIRQRVLALPNVTLVKAAATGLVLDGDRRVVGVEVRGGDSVTGDLVIDATGRVSKSAEWLEDLGFGRPVDQELRSFIGYATVEARLPEDAFSDGVAGVLAHPHPGNCRGAAVVPADNGVYLIAGLGMMNQDPPKDRDGFLAHLDAAPSPLIGEIARKAEFLGEVTSYRIRGSRRRLWEELDDRPDGFLMAGDAVMAFNPLYGQGMSVAACEALALRRTLQEDDSSSGLAFRAQRAMKDVIDTVFGMVISIDGAYEGAELVGVERQPAEAAEFGRALSQLATEDAEAALALKRYAHYFDKSAVTSAGLVAKVADWRSSGRAVTNNDPTAIPGIIG